MESDYATLIPKDNVVVTEYRGKNTHDRPATSGLSLALADARIGKMKRTDLVDVLNLTAPGLSTNDVLPVLAHVWFINDHVITYNDIIGISVPFKSGFTGAVPGKTIAALINNSGAKEITFEPSDNELNIKAGNSRFLLPILPKDAFVFDMPKQSKDASSMSGDFYRHISNCLESCGTDSTVPEQLGVTLIPNDSSLEMFATNNATVTYAKISGKPSLGDRIILSTEFCKQMLTITKSNNDAKLSISNDHALLTTPSGVSLFGKLINAEKPLDFSAMMKFHLPTDVRDKAIEMNASLRNKLKLMIERAIIITNANMEQVRTEIIIENDKIKFFSKSSRGEVTDTTTADGLPDVTISLDCSHLKGMIDGYDKILFTKKCVILTKPDAVFMVAGTRE